MIPTRAQCLLLFDKYNLPSQKRIHVEAVTRLALFFAQKLKQKNIAINLKLIEAAALLHDIDKNIPILSGERHPDTAVRVLNELDYSEVASVVAHHSLQQILKAQTAPQTWEEKILYLADKMTKYEVIGIEHRFKLWYGENLPPHAVAELDAALPQVKALEQAVYKAAGISAEVVAREFSFQV